MGSDSGSKEHGGKGKGDGWHGQGRVGFNKGVLGICLKDVSRHEPLPEGDKYGLRKFEAA